MHASLGRKLADCFPVFSGAGRQRGLGCSDRNGARFFSRERERQSLFTAVFDHWGVSLAGAHRRRVYRHRIWLAGDLYCFIGDRRGYPNCCLFFAARRPSTRSDDFPAGKADASHFSRHLQKPLYSAGMHLPVHFPFARCLFM